MSSKKAEKKEKQSKGKGLGRRREGKKKNSGLELPSKPWKKQLLVNDVVAKKGAEPPSDSPAEILKKAGGHGTNIDAKAVEDPPAGSDAIVPGMVGKLNQQVIISNTSIAYCALGIVLRAIKNGWLARCMNTPTYPYNAWRFLIDTIVNACNGTVDTVTAAPRWWWELLYSLKPKDGNFKTGMINYNLATGDPTNPLDSFFSVGPVGGPDVITIALGIPTGDVLNGFLVLGTAGLYDPALGPTAVASMWSNFANSPYSALITELDESKSYLKGDTSAFAAVYAELGTSFDSPCGIANTLQSERFINSPILSKFCAYQDGGNGEAQWRGFHEYRHSAGSACYILPRMSEFSHMSQVNNKVSPVFKFFNFHEYFTQIVSAMTTAFYNYFNDTNQIANTYPLTVQQFAIMLRQVLMPIFCNDMVQDLRLSQYDSFQAVSFLPFSAGPNGYALVSGTQPLFPQFFAESVRCAKRILADIISPQGNKTGTIDYVPILGAYVDNTGYGQWTVNEVDFFRNDPAELPIELWSCSYFDGTTTTYVDLNGQQMSVAVEQHNLWMTQMTSVFTGLTTIGAEKGITALNIVDTTTFSELILNGDIQPDVPTAKIITKLTSDGKGGVLKIEKPVGEHAPTVPSRTTSTIGGKPGKTIVKLERKNSKGPRILGSPPAKLSGGIGGVPVVNPYTRQQGMTHFLGNQPFLSATWKYKQLIVSPCYWVAAEYYDGTVAEYQVQQMEPYSLPVASTVVFQAFNTAFVTVFDKNYRAGLLDVKSSKSDAQTEMQRDMDALGAMGRGGFFTDLASGLAKTIGEITGW